MKAYQSCAYVPFGRLLLFTIILSWAHSGGALRRAKSVHTDAMKVDELLPGPSEVASAADTSNASATDKESPKSFTDAVRADETLMETSEVASAAEASGASATDEESLKSSADAMKADETLTENPEETAAEASEASATHEERSSTPEKSLKQYIADLLREFDVIDTDSDGKIDEFEFYDVLEKMQGLKPFICSAIFEEYSNGDGFIRKRDIVKMILREVVLTPEGLKKYFDVFKGDNDYISAEDYSEIIHKIYPDGPLEGALKYAQKMIDQFAVEPGKLSMDQFKPLLVDQLLQDLLASKEEESPAAEALEASATHEERSSTPQKSFKQNIGDLVRKFIVIDTDHDGKIHVGEFQNLLEKMQGLEHLQHQVRKMFEKYGSRGDGFIRFHGIVKMILTEMFLTPERLKHDFDAVKGDDDYISAEDYSKVLLKMKPSGDPEGAAEYAQEQIDRFAVEPGKLYFAQFKPFWVDQLLEDISESVNRDGTWIENQGEGPALPKMPQNIAHLLREFDVIDTDRDGKINVGEFQNLLEKVPGLEHLQQNVKGMFEKYSNGDGFIRKRDIVKMILMEVVLTPERLKNRFDIFKGDDDYVSVEDLAKVLLKMIPGSDAEDMARIAKEMIDKFAVEPGKIYIDQFKPLYVDLMLDTLSLFDYDETS